MKEMSAKTKKITPKEEKPKMKTVCIKIDAEQMTDQPFARDEKRFVDHAGKTPVNLEFLAQEHPVGKVHIDEKWGIELKGELKEKLKKFSAILALEEL